MTGAKLTDTSTGYRGLRVTMMADVIDRLTQEQYQTAELLITCLKRGWRAAEVPTIWYPRHSGTTKKGKNWLFGFRYARWSSAPGGASVKQLPYFRGTASRVRCEVPRSLR
jgi:hypothetical protein